MLGHDCKFEWLRPAGRVFPVLPQLVHNLQDVPGIGLSENLDRDVELTANRQSQAEESVQSSRSWLLAKRNFLLQRKLFRAS